MPILEHRRVMSHFVQSLHNGWSLQQKGQELTVAAIVPGGVMQSLLAADRIPDPLYGQNEMAVQWVGETDWVYTLEFERPFEADGWRLCFDGLDTFCTVYLNDQAILESDNMFRSYRIDVQLQNHNRLEVHFRSPWVEGKRLEALHGGALPLWNGDSSRLYVRKAQYHYGWDWGPKLLEMGIWQPVRLECATAQVAEVQVQSHLSADLHLAQVEVYATLEGNFAEAMASLSVYTPSGEVLYQHSQTASHTMQHSFEVQHPELWYTHDLGAQALYRLELRLEQDGVVLHQKDQTFALRKLELVQNPLAVGKTFYFRLNHQDLFCGGANWIPEDLFVPRVSPKRYRAQILAAKNANMNMLRVWGGGIYEQDVFYDLCDELGVLVWQDFMFACGVYPDYFLENFKQEAIQQIKRLRHHPCIAIWTGNNEDYQITYSLRLIDFPAKKIYEVLLPALLAEHAPGAIYQAGSPYQGTDPDDATIGDKHVWNIWGRMAAPYRSYREETARFISEFGLAATAHLETIKEALPATELYPDSPGMIHHLRASEGMWRLGRYLADFGEMPSNLPEFVYRTQLVQSEALDCAFRVWRKGWGRRETGGVLVWQLNDCWMVTSWAIIDSSHRKKPAYYAIKRALAPITINLWANTQETEVWAVNAGSARTVRLELSAFDASGKLHSSEHREVELAANSSHLFAPWIAGQDLVRSARLLDGETVLARHTIFPEPMKHFPFQTPHLSLKWRSDTELVVSADVPVKGVWLDGDLTDNMLDVVPNDPQTIRLETPNQRRELPRVIWYTP